MDSAKRCRDQSAECLRLMKLATSQTEARVLRDIAHSWTRLANQIERYSEFVKTSGLGAASAPMISDFRVSAVERGGASVNRLAHIRMLRLPGRWP
jgi:hypothetical protein